MLFLLALHVFGLTFTIFLGCDEDDETNPIIEGNPDSEEFLLFEDVVTDPALDINKYAMFTTMALLDSFVLPDAPGKTGPLFATAEGDPLIVFDSVSVSLSDYWIIFYFEFTVIKTGIEYSETLYVYGTDSVKVYENDEAVYELIGLPDSVEAREHFHLEYNDTDDSEVNGAGHHALKIGGDYPDSTVVNAHSLDSLMSYFVPEDPNLSLCSLRIVSETDIDDLALPLDSVDADGDVCPLTGSMDLTTTLELGCVGDSAMFNIDGQWNLLISYADGMESITVTYGNTFWHWEGPCE